jgi:hypothetical protein
LVKFIVNGEESGSVQFPITEVGTTSSVSFQIHNNSEDDVELSFWSDDGDMKAESYPTRLKPRETKPAKLLFSPAHDRPDALKTKWGFKELIG